MMKIWIKLRSNQSSKSAVLFGSEEKENEEEGDINDARNRSVAVAEEEGEGGGGGEIAPVDSDHEMLLGENS